MNRIFNIVYSAIRHTYIVCSELAKGKTKSKSRSGIKQLIQVNTTEYSSFPLNKVTLSVLISLCFSPAFAFADDLAVNFEEKAVQEVKQENHKESNKETKKLTKEELKEKKALEELLKKQKNLVEDTKDKEVVSNRYQFNDNSLSFNTVLPINNGNTGHHVNSYAAIRNLGIQNTGNQNREFNTLGFTNSKGPLPGTGPRFGQVGENSATQAMTTTDYNIFIGGMSEQTFFGGSRVPSSATWHAHQDNLHKFPAISAASGKGNIAIGASSYTGTAWARVQQIKEIGNDVTQMPDIIIAAYQVAKLRNLDINKEVNDLAEMANSGPLIGKTERGKRLEALIKALDPDGIYGDNKDIEPDYVAKNTDGISLGYGAVAGGVVGSTALGAGSISTSDQAIAVGSRVRAAGSQSLAMGNDNVTTGYGSIAIGGDDVNVEGGFKEHLELEKLFEIFVDKDAVERAGGKEAYLNKLQGITVEGDTFLNGKGENLNKYFKEHNISFLGNMSWNEFADKFVGTNGNSLQHSPNAALGIGSIAIGPRTVSAGRGSTALGTLSFALGNESTAMGVETYVDTLASGGTAIGEQSRVFAENGLAIGNNSESADKYSAAFGNKAKAIGEGSLALGDNALANASVTKESKDNFKKQIINNINNGTSLKNIDFDIDKEKDIYLSIGDTNVQKSKSKGENALAIGHTILVDSNQGIGLGNSTYVGGDRAIGIGANTIIENDASDSVALGSNVLATKKNTIAVGTGAKVTGENGLAIGYHAVASAVKSQAFGNGAVANLDNSTAIGVNAKTDYTTDDLNKAQYIPAGTFSMTPTQGVGVISVGSYGSERRIINLAGGYRDTDAVNVSQLRALENRIDGVGQEFDDKTVRYVAVHLTDRIKTMLSTGGRFKELVGLEVQRVRVEAAKSHGAQIDESSLTELKEKIAEVKGKINTDDLSDGAQTILSKLQNIDFNKNKSLSDISKEVSDIREESDKVAQQENGNGIYSAAANKLLNESNARNNQAHKVAGMALGVGAKSTAVAAISIGTEAITQGAGGENDALGIAIGYKAHAYGMNVSVGGFTHTDEYSAAGVTDFKVGQVAVGTGATTGTNTGNGQIAIGAISRDFSSNSVALGSLSTVYGGSHDSIAIGHASAARGLGTVVMGTDASSGLSWNTSHDYRDSNASYSVTIGDNAHALNNGSVAIGKNAVAGSYDKEAVVPKLLQARTSLKERLATAQQAYDTQLTEYRKVIRDNSGKYTQEQVQEAYTQMGLKSQTLEHLKVELETIDKDLSLAGTFSGDTFIPNESLTTAVRANNGIYTTAIGRESKAIMRESLALGYQASAMAEDDSFQQGVALGSHATVTNDKAVALGANSTTRNYTRPTNATINGHTYGDFAGTANSVVSVGSAGQERQIVNVAPGEINKDSTDAINGSQLFAVASQFNAENYFHVNDGNNLVNSASEDNKGAINAIGGATGSNSLAAGVGAQAEANNSIAIGNNANAVVGSNSSVVIGDGAKSVSDTTKSKYAEGSIIIGKNASAGSYNGIKVDDTIALGTNSKAYAGHSIAIGRNAHLGYGESMAIGAESYTMGTGSLAIGIGASVEVYNQDYINDPENNKEKRSSGKVENGLALGSNAHTYQNNGVSIGNGANVNGIASIAIGNSASSTGNYSVVLGNDATSESANSVAIGNGATINGRYGTAVGNGASAGTTGSSLGTNASVTASGGVALGIGSFANRASLNPIGLEVTKDDIVFTDTDTPNKVFAFVGENETTNKYIEAVKATVKSSNRGAVSVGGKGKTRQIINVAAGSADTDAVNVAQLKSVASQTFGLSVGDKKATRHLGSEIGITTDGNIGAEIVGTEEGSANLNLKVNKTELVKNIYNDANIVNHIEGKTKIAYTANGDKDKKEVDLNTGLDFHQVDGETVVTVADNGVVNIGIDQDLKNKIDNSVKNFTNKDKTITLTTTDEDIDFAVNIDGKTIKKRPLGDKNEGQIYVDTTGTIGGANDAGIVTGQTVFNEVRVPEASDDAPYNVINSTYTTSKNLVELDKAIGDTKDLGLKFGANVGTKNPVTNKLGSTVHIKGQENGDINDFSTKNILTHINQGEDGNTTIDIMLAKELAVDKVIVGEKGKDGQPGKPGAVGINGKDGASGTITVENSTKGKDGSNGTNGLDGKDGLTRIVYEGSDGENHHVATLDDGLKFAGDNASTTQIAKKLNEQLEIIGGADKNKLTDANIGVNAVNGKLEVKLAKNLKDLEDITLGTDGDKTVINKDGITISNTGKGDVILGDNGLNNGGNKITNVGDGVADSDAVNIGQLKAKTFGVKVTENGVTKTATRTLDNQIDVIDDGNVKVSIEGSKAGENKLKIAVDKTALVNNIYGDKTLVDNIEGKTKIAYTANDGQPKKEVSLADGFNFKQVDGETVVTAEDGGVVKVGINSDLKDKINGAVQSIASSDKTVTVGGTDSDVDLTVNIDGKTIVKSTKDDGTKGQLSVNAKQVANDIFNNGDVIKNTNIDDSVYNKFEQGMDLTYKANGKNPQSVKLSDGLDFKDGKYTTATVAANGEVKFDISETQANKFLEKSREVVKANPENNGYITVATEGAGPDNLIYKVGFNKSKLEGEFDKKYIQHWVVKANGEKPSTIGNEGIVDVINGDNILVTNNNDVNNTGKITIATSMTPNFTSVTTGNTVMNDGGLTISNTDPNKNISITSGNISFGGEQIHNVAEGTAGTDAVNFDQLKDEIKNAIKHIDGNIENITKIEGDHPVMYTDKEGNKVKAADDNKYYTANSFDGDGNLKPNPEEREEVTDVQANVVNPHGGSTNTPTIFGNVASSLDASAGTTAKEPKAKVTYLTTGKINPTDVANVGDLKTLALAGLDFEGNDELGVHKNLGQKLAIKGEGVDKAAATKPFASASGNINVKKNGDGLEIQLAKDLTNMDSISHKDGAKITLGDTNISLGDKNNAPISITNVKAGENDNDAVNKKQLDDLTIAYKANGEAKDSTGAKVEPVKLTEGLNFVNGDYTTAEIAKDGVVKINVVANGSVASDSTGLITGKTLFDEVRVPGSKGTDYNVIDKGNTTSKNLIELDKAVGTKISAKDINKIKVGGNAGLAIDNEDLVTGDVTISLDKSKIKEAAQEAFAGSKNIELDTTTTVGTTIVKTKEAVDFADSVTVGKDANKTFINGTTGTITVGDTSKTTVIAAGKGTFDKAVIGKQSGLDILDKDDQATGTKMSEGNYVTGLTNKDWNVANPTYVSGRAATEDQLKKVSDAISTDVAAKSDWNLIANPATDSNGEYTVDTDGKVTLKVKDANHPDVAAKDVVIKDIAKSDLSNITSDGETKITNLAQAAFKAGKNIATLEKDSDGKMVIKTKDAVQFDKSVTVGTDADKKIVMSGTDGNIKVGQNTTISAGSAQFKDVVIGSQEVTPKNSTGNLAKVTGNFVTGLDNKDWNITDPTYVSGRAATEDQLKKVSDAISNQVAAKSDWRLIQNPANTKDGHYEIDAKGDVTLKVQNQTKKTEIDDVVIEGIAKKADLDQLKDFSVKYKNDGTTADKTVVELEGKGGTTISNVKSSIESATGDDYLTKLANAQKDKDKKDDAVNVSDLGNVATGLVDKGLNFGANIGKDVTNKLGSTVEINGNTKAGLKEADFSTKNILTKVAQDEQGKTTIDIMLAKAIEVDKVTVGDTTKPGIVAINGKDGATAEITVKQGLPNLDGTENANIPRIVYGDHEIATMNDGLIFKGDTANKLSKKLGQQVDIIGGASQTKLSDNNIGVSVEKVTALDGKEREAILVKLARQLKGLESAVFDTVVDDSGNVTTVAGDSLTVGKDGITIKNPNKLNIVLGDKGLNNGGNKITNVAKGEADTDAVNVSQLNDTIKNKQTQLKDGEHTRVEGDGSKDAAYTVNVVTGNLGNTQGQANVDGAQALKTAMDQAKAALDKANESGVQDDIDQAQKAYDEAKAEYNNANNAIATVANVADAINNSGFNLQASGDNKQLINPGHTIDLTGKELAADGTATENNGNIQVSQSTKDGKTTVHFDLSKNLKLGDISNGELSNNGSIDGIKDHLDQPKEEPNTHVLSKPEGIDKKVHQVANVNDVLNAGWNIQEGTTQKGFINPYDTVSFVNGQGTTASVTKETEKGRVEVTYNVATDGKTTEIKNILNGKDVVKGDGSNNTDPNKWYVANAQGKPDSTQEVAKTQEDDITSVVSAIIPKADGTETKLVDGSNTTVEGSGKDGDEYKVNVTTGTLGNDTEGHALGTTDKTKAEIDALTNAVKDAKEALAKVDPQDTDALKAAEAKLAKAETAYDNAGLNKVATVQNVADAINNSGFTLQGDGTGDSLVNPGDTVNLKGKEQTVGGEKVKNINITNTDGQVEFALNKDLTTINSISNGTTGNGAKITLGDTDKNISVNGGKITGVASSISDQEIAGNNKPTFLDKLDQANKKNPTNAVNVSDLHNLADEINTDVSNQIDNVALSFAGDRKSKDATQNTFERKNGETTTIKGGAEGELSENNIGVVSNGNGELNVQLAKDVKDLNSVTVGQSDNNGNLEGDGVKLSNDGKITVNGTGADGKQNTITVDGDKGTIGGLTNTSWDPDNITSGQAATEDQLKAAINNVTNEIKDNVIGNISYKSTNDGESSSKENVNLADGFNFTGGTNTTASVGKDGEVSFDLKKDLDLGKDGSIKTGEGDNQVAVNGKDGSITVGDQDNQETPNTVINNGGITITPAQPKPEEGEEPLPELPKVVLDQNGLNNGGNKITNVAPGTDPTDAVNVSQLNNFKAEVGNTFNQFSNRINNIDKRARAGIAAAGAMATLPQEYRAGRSQFAMASTYYRGESAMAVGFSRVSDNSKWIIRFTGSTNSQKDTMVGAGFGYSW